MKKIIILLLLFFGVSIHSQEIKNRYYQAEIATPLIVNSTYGDVDSLGNRSNYWFLPDGLSLKFGVGIHQKKWASLGIHSGIDWLGSNKLVVVPVFANFKLSPKISEDSRIYLQLGYGKSIGIGRGSLIGDYRKICLGAENDEGFSIYIQVANFGIPLNNLDSVSSLSLGVALATF
jgi:hypothetical protein